jgi:hypothetical protein
VEASLRILEVRLDSAVRNRDGPEQTATCDSGIVVMSLNIRATRARFVDVESNEGKRAAMAFAISADVRALHEPVV